MAQTVQAIFRDNDNVERLVGNIDLLGAVEADNLAGVTVTGTPSAGEVLTATSATAAHWAAGGGATVQVTHVTLDDAAVKALLTPVTLVAQPDPQHCAIPLGWGGYLDDSNGVYVDPDGAFTGLSILLGGAALPALSAFMFIDDASLDGTPGPGVYPWFFNLNPLSPGQVAFNLGPLFGAFTLTPGDLVLGKNGAANFTGGGVGNAFVFDLYWVSVQVSP